MRVDCITQVFLANRIQGCPDAGRVRGTHSVDSSERRVNI
ncbi:hypothetical protein T09_12763 [Trichinella sp. T9]|nr:hypothetical protein T09_12763 [Trichinella sp. T9]